MARPNPSFFNARIPAELHGQFFSGNNTKREYLRYERFSGYCQLWQLFGVIQCLGDVADDAPQEVIKKRSRRTIKSQRGIVGASLDLIKEKRGQRLEVRVAARQAAIKEGKDKRAAAASAKKAEKARLANANSKGQTSRLQSKQGAKGAPKKIQATSR